MPAVIADLRRAHVASPTLVRQVPTPTRPPTSRAVSSTSGSRGERGKRGKRQPIGRCLNLAVTPRTAAPTAAEQASLGFRNRAGACRCIDSENEQSPYQI